MCVLLHHPSVRLTKRKMFLRSIIKKYKYISHYEQKGPPAKPQSRPCLRLSTLSACPALSVPWKAELNLEHKFQNGFLPGTVGKPVVIWLLKYCFRSSAGFQPQLERISTSSLRKLERRERERRQRTLTSLLPTRRRYNVFIK